MNSLITVDAGKMIDGFRSDLAPLLAENNQSFDRLKSVFMIAVQQNPDILKCTEDSIRREMGKCAADGLVPDNKEAAMIPYKGVLQYQPMVYGIIKRMKELGGVFNIVCNLVFEKDEFVLDEADPDSLSHKSDPFSNDRGKVVGGYVIFRDEKKRLMHLETMSLEDFEKVRKASKAPESPAWKNWTQEMYRKAVLRRGAKYISTNNDKIRALLERQDDMFDFNQPRVADRVDPFSGHTIEHEAQTASNDQKKASGDDAGRAKTDAKPLPDNPPDLPDVMVQPADVEKAKECAEKILGMSLDMKLDPAGRRGVLKGATQQWKEALPEYLHDFLKACVDMADWAIRRDARELAWAAEHAMFVHKVKQLLDVEKLNVGKYP